MQSLKNTNFNCVIFNLDGTLCASRWPEDFKDDSSLLEVPPTDGARDAVEIVRKAGKKVIIWTSRPESLRSITIQWLKANDIYYDQLWTEKPAFHCIIDDRALNFDGLWNGIAGRAAHFQTWWEIDRDGPLTFENALDDVLKHQRDVMIDRQGKYGPNNILQIGVLGAIDRAAKDKIARLLNVYQRERLRRECREAGMPQPVIDRYLPAVSDTSDETVEDSHIDAANYLGPIGLMLLRGTWGRPLGKDFVHDPDPDAHVAEPEDMMNGVSSITHE